MGRDYESAELPRLSGLAVVAFLLGTLALMSGYGAWICFWLAGNQEVIEGIGPGDVKALETAGKIVATATLLPALLSTLFALAGWLTIAGSRGRLRGRGFCFMSLVAAVLAAGALLVPVEERQESLPSRVAPVPAPVAVPPPPPPPVERPSQNCDGSCPEPYGMKIPCSSCGEAASAHKDHCAECADRLGVCPKCSRRLKK
jgi:hypothetical protein